MAIEDSTVADIESAALRKFAFPAPVREALTDMEFRVREALAVARLLSHHLEAPPGLDSDEGTAMGAADAVVRLLEPVHGLNEEQVLIRWHRENLKPQG